MTIYARAVNETDGAPIDRLAQLLLAARSEGRALPPIDPDLVPPTDSEAEAVDDLVAQRIGRPTVGWKIGCTSTHAQQLLGTDGPFAGRIYDLHDSGFTLGPSDICTEPRLEGEFAFVLRHDLPPVAAERSRQEVVAAVAGVRPAIEVVGGRWEQFVGAPVRALMADAGANTRLVVGALLTDWDPDVLADTEVTMRIDGRVVGNGIGRDVLGDPIEALRWLVNRLSGRGLTLAAGDTITTGTATQVAELPAGATAVADIDGIGSVTLHRST